MPRLPHGRVNITIDTLREARDTVAPQFLAGSLAA
jgi:hypothetical protein